VISIIVYSAAYELYTRFPRSSRLQLPCVSLCLCVCVCVCVCVLINAPSVLANFNVINLLVLAYKNLRNIVWCRSIALRFGKMLSTRSSADRQTDRRT